MTLPSTLFRCGVIAIALGAVGCDAYQSAPPPTASPDVTVTVAEDVTLLPEVTADAEDPTNLRPAHCSAKITPGPSPLRRLTNTEYNNTVRDLLGDGTRPADRFPPEEETLGFDNNAAGRGVGVVHIELYMQTAETLIREAIENRRSQIIQCDIGLINETICARETVTRFARRAYRRRLTQREIDRFVAYFLELRAASTFDESIIIILEVVLQSPHFLYRTEFGQPDDDEDGVVALTGSELATRLSYTLWGSPPDDELLAAAEIGELDTALGVAGQARRMLNDPRARDQSTHFHNQWLLLKKLATTFKDTELIPEYTPELRDLFQAETQYFVDYVIFGGGGDFKTLMSGSFTFLNKALADHYDLPSDGMDDTFQKYNLPPAQRAGVLTQASMMSILAKFNQTSPVLRGHFVRDHILCQYIAPPPADINITPPDLDPNLTTRERFRQHTDDPQCAGCHTKMDPVGLAFENYDPIGRWRTHEGDLLVDASGELKFTWDANGTVDNAVQMLQRLGESEEVRTCYARQWFRYAHGRDVGFDDECHLYDLMKAFETHAWDIKELMVALTQTEAFRYRRAIIPGSDAPTIP